MCHAGRVPCVTSLDALHQAVAGFAVTDLDLPLATEAVVPQRPQLMRKSP